MSTLQSALITTSWGFANPYSVGLDNVSFSFDISKVAHQPGYIFAQKLSWLNNDGIGYVGIEPREDSDGNSIIHAVFKSFVNGSEGYYAPSCFDGADGRPGVSCEVDVPGSYDHRWALQVDYHGANAHEYWYCSLTDANTGEATEVGYIIMPNVGNIVNAERGFIGYLPFENEPSPACVSLPAVEVIFYDPVSDNALGVTPTEPKEDGDCNGREGFSASGVFAGWKIKLGF